VINGIAVYRLDAVCEKVPMDKNFPEEMKR
jgi:hypothetical protein